MPTEQLVFANVAWMAHYQGPKGDKAEGGFAFLRTNGIAHESWNFEPTNGTLYGYVPRSAAINISRLGAKPGDKAIEGATVVWIARNPRTKKTVIVGWYRNATIHKDAEHWRLNRESDFPVGYQIKAPATDCVLLPVDGRSYPIPTAKEKGNLGQSPIWYGKSDNFNRAVLAYVQNGGNANGNRSKSPKQSDPELRRKIEQAAINHAIEYYESEAGGFRHVESVEKDGVGWDLEATGSDDEMLKVEVKGLSGNSLVVELTPNEYAQMQSAAHRKHYVIYVLLEALKDTKRAEIFRHDAVESNGSKLIWSNDDGAVLKIEQRIAARLSLI